MSPLDRETLAGVCLEWAIGIYFQWEWRALPGHRSLSLDSGVDRGGVVSVSSPCFSLTYISSATKPLSDEELQDLLRVSRDHNSRTEITGMLWYKGLAFIHLLEGDESAVRFFSAAIERDTRHRSIVVLSTEYARRRQFSDWSMGFCNIDTESTKPASLSEFLNLPLTGTQLSGSPERAEKLLLLFKSRR